MDEFDLIKIAEEWHGGQDSALYSLLSTRMFHSIDHIVECEMEIEHCLREVNKCPNTYDRKEAARLQEALDYIKTLLPAEPD